MKKVPGVVVQVSKHVLFEIITGIVFEFHASAAFVAS
jgi:hypothetical protein